MTILAYCDYIADCIKRALVSASMAGSDPIIKSVSRILWDLHPDGHFLSTKKTLEVTDHNGKLYRVTVEEVTP